MSLALEAHEIIAEESERSQIGELREYLARHQHAMLDGVELPQSVLRLLREALPHLEAGEMVTLFPLRMELTTREAADLLNVSRQYVVQLLTEEKMPHHMVGTHRRIYLSDLMAYKQQRDEHRARQRDRLVRISERAGLYEKE